MIQKTFWLPDEKIDQIFLNYLPNLKSKIIVFEGVNGSGKTTYAHALGETIASAGYDVLVTQEPGHIPVNWELVGTLDSTAQCLLYLADRIEHIHSVIKPALVNDAIVICDRFFDSSYVYHPDCPELVKPHLDAVLADIGQNIYRIFWLDLPPAIAINVVEERAKKSVGVVPKILKDFQRVSEAYEKTMGMSPIRKRHRISLPSHCAMREIKESLVFGDGGLKPPNEF